MIAKRSRPSSRIGSNTLYRSSSGSTSSIGQPLILMSPRPFLQYETATAVFLRPNVCTDSIATEVAMGERLAVEGPSPRHDAGSKGEISTENTRRSV